MVKLKEPESMEECEYFSRRSLENGHKAVVWVPKGTMTMNVNYDCFKCGHEGSITDEYGLPYTFYCESCGEEIKIQPLKGKAKGVKKKPKKKKIKEE